MGSTDKGGILNLTKTKYSKKTSMRNRQLSQDWKVVSSESYRYLERGVLKRMASYKSFEKASN